VYAQITAEDIERAVAALEPDAGPMAAALRRDTARFIRASASGTAIPLPPELTPTSSFDWTEFTDDEIMALDPTLVAHLNNTAAQGGLQIVSPSLATLGSAAVPVDKTTLPKVGVTAPIGAHKIAVASEANASFVWPVLPDEAPIDMAKLGGGAAFKYGEPKAIRSPSDYEPLRSMKEAESDPYTTALLTAKANVDLQRSEEVSGDYRGLAAAYEELWGMKDGGMDADGPVMTVVPRSLLRYAIGAASGFARSLDPIQVRRTVVSVIGAGTRDVAGRDRAYDWNKIRAVAEAKFAMWVDVEGKSLTDMSLGAVTLLGNPRADCLHPDICVFQPGFNTSWYCGADSFALMVPRVYRRSSAKCRAPVSNVLEYAGKTSLIAKLTEAVGSSLEAVATFSADEASADVVMAGVAKIVRSFTSVTSSPKTPDAAAATALHGIVVSAEPADLVGLSELSRFWATDMQIAGFKMRERDIIAVAARLGALDAYTSGGMRARATAKFSTEEAWWHSASYGTPDFVKELSCNTQGWATLIAYKFMQSTSTRWDATRRAVITKAATVTMAMSTLPAAKATGEPRLAFYKRLLDAFVPAHNKLWFAKYNATSFALITGARAAKDAGDMNAWAAMMAEAYMWTFRARMAQSTRMEVVEAAAPLRAPSTYIVTMKNDATFMVDGTEYRLEVSAPAENHLAALGNKKTQTSNPALKTIFKRLPAGWAELDPLSVLPSYLTPLPMKERVALTKKAKKKKPMPSFRVVNKYTSDPGLLAKDCANFLVQTGGDALGTITSAVTSVIDEAPVAMTAKETKAAQDRFQAAASKATEEMLALMSENLVAETSNTTGYKLMAINADADMKAAIADALDEALAETGEDPAALEYDSYEDFITAIFGPDMLEKGVINLGEGAGLVD
jgi:hypothetical protein